ncbi:hypothetical protein RI845_13505 [Thalassotalea nanhaiensis]|uniref:Uncharacterized protein n=1 Tax=Thalassotalea nanhaiensis TaxID=3065648 RepID=A0ABY9TFH7_9GAMM|nr:hypothetical protein RI845_13505 [Colwelliaceae bacterium SQ345]
MNDLSMSFKSALYFDALIRSEINANFQDVKYPESFKIEELSNTEVLIHIDGQSLIGNLSLPIKTDQNGRKLLSGILRHFRTLGLTPAVQGKFNNYPKSYFLVINRTGNDGKQNKLIFTYINSELHFYKEVINA